MCANVYGGTDYMPRIIGRITTDPGHQVLAAEAIGEPQHVGTTAEPAHPETRIDAVICSERRGGALFLYGLRVREDTRGRGLGHLLMEAICQSAPEADAAPPAAPPHPAPPASTASTQPRTPPSPGPLSPPPPSPAPPPPISHIVTCTTSYNPAAQRIIGRQLRGPLCEAEVWPGHGALEAYEAAAGWVRGRGVPPGAPNMLDWIQGARQTLEADGAAQVLLPRWRRAASEAELRRAVAHMLYGGDGGGAATHGCDVRSNGCSDGDVSVRAGGGGNNADAGGVGDAEAACSTVRELKPLLWLPMPYDVWPLDSPFVRRELAAGNVWLLTAPSGGGGHAAKAGGGDVHRYEAAATAGGSGSGGQEGEGVVEAKKEEDNEEGQEEEVVGVMLLTYFDTLSRVCAGILAADNAATHAAIAHAGALHPHFFASVLRSPCTAKPPMPASAAAVAAAPQPASASAAAAGPTGGAQQGAAAAALDSKAEVGSRLAAGKKAEEAKQACSGRQAVERGSALPALYSATGGYRDFWVYGRAWSSG